MDTVATTTSIAVPRTPPTLAGGSRPLPSAALAPTIAAGPVGESDELVGSSVGRYRVVARLGAGGMGVVYRAVDPALDRTVALKVLPPLDEERRTHLEERLRREAQALARLDHHNVVAVHDVGIAEQSLFVAMQFVDGTTLDDHLRRHPARPRRVLALFVAAGRGLGAAHAAGIVHRDVKPSNILVDRGGRVYVGDFGLARGAGDAPEAHTSQDDLLVADMTRAGAVLGTPLFMAPEQHRGEQATARSDQFSFCVSVWYELFGAHPFSGERWDHAAALTAMEADRLVEPPRIRGLPARAVRALRRGLRHDPAARWPGMTDLLAELEPRRRSAWLIGGGGLVAGAVVAGVALGAVGGTDPCANAADRVADAPARVTRMVAALGAVKLPYASATASLVASTLAGYTREWSETRVDACRANRVRRDQSDELFDKRVACLEHRAVYLDGVLATLSERPTPELVDRAVELAAGLPGLAECGDLAHLAAIQPAPADPAIRDRIAAIDRELTALAAAPPDGRADAVARAEALTAGARATGWNLLLARALRHEADARNMTKDADLAVARLREASRVAAKAHDDTAAAESIVTLAQWFADGGKAPDALVVLDDAEVLVQRAGDTPWLRFRLDHARGTTLGELGRFRESDAAYSSAAALARREPPDQFAIALANLLVDQSNYLKQANEVERARDSLVEAQRIYSARLTPDHPKLAPLHQQLGNLYFQLKDIPRAKAEHARTQAIIAARFAPDSPEHATAQFNAGFAAIHENRYDDAATAFAESAALMLQQRPDHPNGYAALYMQATARFQQARYDEALPIFQRVLDWRVAHLGEDHIKVADVAEAISRIQQAKHDFTGALASLRRVLAIREKALGPDNPDVAWTLSGLAGLDYDRGDCGEAEKHARRALALLDRSKSEPYLRIDALVALGECATEGGRLAEARAFYDEVLPIVDEPDAATIDQRATARIGFAELLYRAGERARARTVAREVAELAAAGGNQDDAARAKAWLAAH